MVAGVVLNPLLPSRAVLAGGICAHGEEKRPAYEQHLPSQYPCASGLSPYSPALQGASGMWLPAEEPPAWLSAPQNLGLLLGCSIPLWM